MKLHKIAFLLLIIGGLNWLVLALFGVDVGDLFGGQAALVSKIIYILVGLSAIYEIVGHKEMCKECTTKGMSGPQM